MDIIELNQDEIYTVVGGSFFDYLPAPVIGSLVLGWIVGGKDLMKETNWRGWGVVVINMMSQPKNYVKGAKIFALFFVTAVIAGRF